MQLQIQAQVTILSSVFLNIMIVEDGERFIFLGGKITWIIL